MMCLKGHRDPNLFKKVADIVGVPSVESLKAAVGANKYIELHSKSEDILVLERLSYPK